ncbi:Transposon TX1 putative 149 kDa protein-like protein [Drosera capensis]
MRAIWEDRVIECPLFKVVQKVKRLRHPLKELHQSYFSILSIRIKQQEEQFFFFSLKQQLLDCHFDELLMQLRCSSSALNELYTAKDMMLRQKVKDEWFLLMDRNTKYFYSVIEERRRRTQVCAMGPTLDQDLVNALIFPFTVDDVKKALWVIDDYKAPGVDGYNAHFFKKCCDIVGPQVTTTILDFFKNHKILKEINVISLTLVTKYPNASRPCDFGPIVSCSTLYKIILKMIYSRMDAVMGHLVSASQNVFVKGNPIIDNVSLCLALLAGCIGLRFFFCQWEEIEPILRDFLWTGLVLNRKRALAAWDKIKPFVPLSLKSLFVVRDKFKGVIGLINSVYSWPFTHDSYYTVSSGYNTPAASECRLCGHGVETRDHLFLLCPYSLDVVHDVLVEMKLCQRPLPLSSWLAWMMKVTAGNLLTRSQVQYGVFF